MEIGAGWDEQFERWLVPFLDAFGHKVRRRWAPVYVRGLLGPGERKSIEPLVARVATGDRVRAGGYESAMAAPWAYWTRWAEAYARCTTK